MNDRERHARAKAVFLDALARPAAEREAFVTAACAGDDALGQEVTSLLAHAGDSEDLPPGMQSTTRRLETGETFAGRYRIVAHLGSGAMGDVYRVVDTTLDVEVALKVLRERSPDLIAQLLDEVRLARRVTHPAICRVYDVDHAEDTYFFTMEYVRGEDLASLLARIGRLPSDKVREIGRQICEGLAVAHAQGVLHRDIKPTNVMLDADGAIRITDFGVATVEGAERLELPAGTPAYMAPEQLAEGAPASVATDLFAVGLVLYEALAGQAPAADAEDVVGERKAGRFPAPSRLVVGVDPELEAVILDLLRADPAARPPSAAAVVERLGRRTAAEELSPPVTTPPVTHRVGASLAFVLLGVAAFWLAARAGWLPGFGPASVEEVLGPAEQRSGIGIAVMPTLDQSGQGAPSDLSEAIQDALIERLSRAPGLRVIAEDATDRLGATADPHEVGDALGADFVAQSRIEEMAGILSLVVELRKAQSGEVVWSTKEQRTIGPDELHQAETSVAEQILETLEVAAPTAAGDAAGPPTRNPDAFRLYLRGRLHVPPYTRAEVEQALSLLKEAVELDPGLAKAYAGIAKAYTHACERGWMDPRNGYTRARRYAERALELDKSLDEAYVVMGLIATKYDWDWARAEAAFQAALAINPSSEAAWRVAAEFFSSQQRFTESLKAAIRSVELNPTSAVTLQNAAMRFYEARRFDRAEALARIAVRVDPLYPLAYRTLGLVLLEQHEDREAIRQMRRAIEVGDRDVTGLAWLAYAHWRSGEEEEARAATEQALLLGKPDGVAATLLAIAQNDPEGAVRALAAAIEGHGRPSIWLATAPLLDPLRERPDFEALVRRVGLPAHD